MVVANSSPLIHLAALEDFELLRPLFTQIAVSEAVYQEVITAGADYPVARAVREAHQRWIHTRPVIEIARVRERMDAGLHSGESEALILAGEVSAEAPLLDDRDAVGHATSASTSYVRQVSIDSPRTAA